MCVWIGVLMKLCSVLGSVSLLLVVVLIGCMMFMYWCVFCLVIVLSWLWFSLLMISVCVVLVVSSMLIMIRMICLCCDIDVCVGRCMLCLFIWMLMVL